MNLEKLLLKHEGLIHNLCRAFISKFPSYSVFEIEDLKQECRLALYDSFCRKQYDESKSALSTFCFKVIRRKLITILKTECRSKRSSNIVDYNLECVASFSDDVLRKVMVKEFICACINSCEVSDEFINTIINGASEELILAERSNRRKRVLALKKKGVNIKAENTKVKYSKRILENFFKTKISKLKELSNSILE